MSTSISGKRIFVTGGAGFIGSRLISRLVDRNEMVVYDTFDRDALTGLGISDHANLRVIKGDVLDVPALRSAIAGAELVVHCAGIAGIDTVIKKPTRTMAVNMIGSANVLEEASRLPNCERVVCF